MAHKPQEMEWIKNLSRCPVCKTEFHLDVPILQGSLRSKVKCPNGDLVEIGALELVIRPR